MTDIAAALGDGWLPNLDAVLPVRESTIVGGPAAGTRAIDIAPWDGIGVRILPDRGFDLGQAWYRGTPLAWVSQHGETAPLEDLAGMNWSTGFGGGLLVTCGLRNVGMPSEGQGLHGSFSHLPAVDVSVERVADDEGARVVAKAAVTDRDGDATLRLERSLTVWASQGRVAVSDTTTNLGAEPEAAPILYHFNFGFPLWSSGARLDIPSEEVVPRDPDSEPSVASWAEPLAPQDGPERVLEHVLPDSEWGWARISAPHVGVRLRLRWRRAELPRLHQWVDPKPGMCVLGVEPANCSTSGRSFDRAGGRLPMLEPGENRVTNLIVEAEPL